MLKLTEYFLKHPRVTNMLVILIFLAGILASFSLVRQSSPKISFGLMQIVTVYPGASPEDVEVNVTTRIEEQLKSVENIKKLSSMSMENISIITVEIDSDAGKPEATKIKIRDAVDRTSNLPDAVTQKPRVEEVSTASFPLLEIAISGKVPELELRKYARDLEARLRDVSGVGLISKLGYRKREIKINADIEKMRVNQISFAQVMRAIQARNIRATGGTIESFISEKKIVTLSEYENLMDAGKVIIRSNFGGNRLTISDIAELSDDFEEPRNLYRGNGKPAIALVVTTQDNADSIKLSEGLQKELKEFQKSLPDTVEARIIFDYSIYTRIMVDLVLVNGLVGFLLVLLVMFVFLDLRSAFWAAFGIPFSILGALGLFALLGITLNQVTLVTMILVLGIIVDDAIVVTEKIYVLKQQGLKGMDAVMQGVRSMMLPVSAAITTTMLAFVPMLFIGGIFGKFLSTIPLVMALVLAFSWIESLLFLPAHLLHAEPPAEPPARSRWLETVKAVYFKNLGWALEHRLIVMLAFGVVLLSVAGLSYFKMDFMLDQNRDPDVFTIIIESPQGTSLESTNRMIGEVEKLLTDSVPKKYLKSFTTQVGTHGSLGANTGNYSNWAVITAYLHPAAERDIESEVFTEKLWYQLFWLRPKAGFQRLDVAQIDGGLSAGKAVELNFITNDDILRYTFEKEALALLRKQKGVKIVESSNVAGKEELRLRLDYRKLAQVGLTALDVASTVRTAFDGAVVTSLRKHGEEIDYRVRLKNPRQYRAQGVLKLPIANARGQLIPLGVFAKFEKTPGPAVLHHLDAKRSVKISADIDDTVTTSKKINAIINKTFAERVAKIPGFSMKLGGQEQESMASLRGLMIALLLALLGIYFLLVVLFNSYLQPFMIMSIIPFAVVGVFITLMMHDMPLTFISMIGMLGLIGVVINDTIVMLTHLNHKLDSDGESLESVAKGALDRFRPVLLTTLTTFAGLLPTCYGIGGDLPDLRPMVLVMAWGLVFATFITLVFTPVLYSLLRLRGK